ncbi:MAG TPA: PadR family transcriptional regulator [Steroidobacteraceae bacterium]|nr:PadR family transcriptional regulator [Steroidobacteraceae bacterium]
MDVKTVCLGLLTFGEASGYDLKKHFEESFEHFFSAGYGSIYPALAALADEGLVSCREISQDGKPDRKVYRITEAGRARLESTLGATAPGHKLRSEFLATIYFAHLVSPDRLEAILNHRLAELDRMLGHLDACPEHADWPAGVRFVRGFGEAVITAAKAYIETHRDELTTESKLAAPDRRDLEQAPAERKSASADWVPV